MIDGVVQKPPAAEDVQVAELARGDAELVLIFAREHRAEEFVVGKRAQSRSTAPMSARPTLSPASRSGGFTLRFTPIIIAKACPCSRPCGMIACSMSCAAGDVVRERRSPA